VPQGHRPLLCENSESAMPSLVVLLSLFAAIVTHRPAHIAGPSAFLLAGESIAFNAAGKAEFTANQLRNSSDATRRGFLRWAATPHGREVIARFDAREFAVLIEEDSSESGLGRAPQPALGTLIAAGNHTARKTYTLILNPNFDLPQGFTPMPGEPATSEDMMAAAWAGEMLHVDFYARGISLPHHERDDFQEEWRLVARELGFPNLAHAAEDEERPVRRARPRVTRWRGW
jgi:hypothetical protein